MEGQCHARSSCHCYLMGVGGHASPLDSATKRKIMGMLCAATWIPSLPHGLSDRIVVPNCDSCSAQKSQTPHRTTMKATLTALTAGLLLVSCAPSTPQARIQREPEKFAALSENHKNLVQQGQIGRGMPADAVYLAWGRPSNVFLGSKNQKTTERWDYAGSRPIYFTGFYGAYGPYGYSPSLGFGSGFGPDVAYIPHRLASVWFLNNRVDSWERAK